MRFSGSDAMRRLFSFRNLVLVAPILMLTVKHWISAAVIFTAFAAIAHLVRTRRQDYPIPPELRRARWFVSLALLAPLIANTLGQIFRGHLYLANYDPPLHLMFCIPILWAVSRGWLDKTASTAITVQWLQTIFPITLVWTCFHRIMWPNTSWGSSESARLTTSFVDPLMFGSLCLLFSMMCIAGLLLFPRRHKASTLLSLAGVVCGVYLAITSGSRTGWLSLPIFTITALVLIAKSASLRRSSWILLSTLAIGSAIIALIGPFLLPRLLIGLSEFQSYRWNGMNPDSSVAMRIAFFRMGLFFFFQNPIGGWGDTGWLQLVHAPEISVYASEYTRRFAINGFHSEIMTNAVRSGIWGLVSSVNLFVTPFVLAITFYRRSTHPGLRAVCLFLLIFLTHQFLAGLSTEVTALTFQASFFGLCIALAFGEIMHRQRQERQPDHQP